MRWPSAAAAGLRWVLRHARARVRDRENLRLERTRLFGRVRRIFVELGRRLHALDLLDEPRDIFYLEVDEVLAFVDGRSTTHRTCARWRRCASASSTSYEQLPPPADRFETRGPVYHGHDVPAAPAPTPAGQARSARAWAAAPASSRPGPRRHRPARRRSASAGRSSSPSTPTPAGSCCSPRRRGAGRARQPAVALGHRRPRDRASRPSCRCPG